MRTRCFLVFQCLLTAVFGNFSPPVDNPILSALEGEPSVTIAGCLNPISGDYVIAESDLMIPGVEPIIFHRSYVSGTQQGKEAYWSFFPHIYLHLSHTTLSKDYQVIITVAEPSGAVLRYKNLVAKDGRCKKEFVPMLGRATRGITNTGHGYIGGQTNIANHRIIFDKAENRYIMTCGDGSKRYYKQIDNSCVALLRKERKPNGNWIHYEYHDNNSSLRSIRTTNPSESKTYAQAFFVYQDPKPYNSKTFAVITPNQQKLHYFFHLDDVKTKKTREHYFRLNHIARPYLPSDQLHYQNIPYSGDTFLITGRKLDDKPIAEVHYYNQGEHTVDNRSILIKESGDPANRRVKSLEQPVGPDGSLRQTQLLIYNLGKYLRNRHGEFEPYLRGYGYVDCFDAYHKKTTYAFNDRFVPLCIARHGIGYLQGSGENPLYQEHFSWEFNGLLSMLCSKFIYDHGTCISKQLFAYDSRGNIIKENLIGNISGHNHSKILHGSPPTSVEKADTFSTFNTYSPDDYNLLIKKELPNGICYEYQYLPHTNLLVASFTCIHGHIKIRQFNTYNEDNILIETIQDDGSSYDRNNLTDVSQRLLTSISPKQSLPAINFPEILEEKYLDLTTNSYHLLKKRVLHYDKDCNVLQEDLYDAKGNLAYSLYTTYDEKQRVTSSKDALGRSSVYHYDNYNHLVQEKRGDSPLTIRHCQDVLGRELVTTTIDSQKGERTTTTHYDLTNRVEKIVDPFGNVSTFAYDDLGYEREKVLPPMQNDSMSVCAPKITTLHDARGKPLQITDALGRTTFFTYNLFGDPVSITYPDHTVETFTYRIDGALESHTTITGLKECVTQDPLGRVTRKQVFSKEGALLYEESSVYNSFHLLSHTDKENVKTSYLYDGAGRKISTEKTRLGELLGKESYEYDPLGRLYKTITHSQDSLSQVFIQIFDLANRLIEERQEDVAGTLFAKTSYQYDAYDNKISILIHSDEGAIQEKFTYDDYKRITSHTDAQGNVTFTAYKDKYYNRLTSTYDSLMTTTDPKGRKIKERFDVYHHLTSRTFLNSLGKIEGEEFFFYDSAHNKIKEYQRVYAHEECVRVITTLREYDENDRLITLIQAYRSDAQKVTRFSYTLEGKEQTICQPSGVSLEYVYDQQSRLVHLFSSDRSIDYSLVYDEYDNLSQVDNLLDGSSSHRTYDARGNVLTDLLANGLSLTKTYDDLGRNSSLTFSDGSKILYTFDAFHLKTVSRLTTQGSTCYEHHYTSYNGFHRPTQEESLAGTVTRSYDEAGRLSSMTTAHCSESIDKRDSCGNILALTFSSSQQTTSSLYTYDELDHLIEEAGTCSHHYDFDSQHTRIAKDHVPYSCDTLSELLHDGSSSYTYSANGNRITKQKNGKTLTYTYDALNRLISLQTDAMEVLFTYDFWHRRLSKTIRQPSWLGYWSTSYQELYLYDQDSEIGCADSSGNILQLKVLGLGAHGDIGGAVAIELQGTVYAPLHDLMGNIVQLIHAQGEYIAESYSYSAFGETTLYNYYNYQIAESALGNPWQYQSKRVDVESGLIFFGRRYYDPCVGSWLSEDPLGLAEGPNLYHFLLGNPLANIDIYGLSAADREDEDLSPSYVKPPPIHGYVVDENPYRYRPWELSPPVYLPPPPPIRGMPIDVLPRGPPAAPSSPALPKPTSYAFLFINGMNTSFDETKQMTSVCSSHFTGYEVNHFYNPSHGFFVDVLKVYRLLDHSNTRVIEEFRATLFKHLNAGREIFIFAHSCGGLVAYNALETLHPSHREKISIFTFGSAKFIPRDFAKEAVNYISKWDLIAKTSNGGARLLANGVERRKYHDPSMYDIRWLNSRSLNPLKEHSFMGETYQQALESSARTIYYNMQQR